MLSVAQPGRQTHGPFGELGADLHTFPERRPIGPDPHPGQTVLAEKRHPLSNLLVSLSNPEHTLRAKNGFNKEGLHGN
jgi:hypothetical protein